MEVKNVFACLLLEFTILTKLVLGQVLLEELKAYNIDPMEFNGTDHFTELTIDQIIVQASGGAGMYQNLVMGENGTILAELDMRLTKDQFSNLYESPTDTHTPVRGKRGNPRRNRRNRQNKRTKRKAIRDVILRWHKGEVPYRFVPGHFQQKEEYLMRSAMTEWEKYTCLKFRPSTNNDRNLVRFQNGLGCNSQLGMVGGEQPLNLDKNGCRYKGLYLHEIGHAVGLVHEHQLPDRDSYIEILYGNVQPNMRIWFNKYSSQEVNQMSVPYEYSSVMHYGITAFSSDGKSQTIKALKPGKEKSIGRVYRKELSFSDVKIVNLMYKCAEHCGDTVVCNGGGFVDQNCKCICPDGTDSCTKSKLHDKDPACYNANEDWQCQVWANQGECDRNPRFMLESCKKACKLCGTQEEESDTCDDKYDGSKCQTWKENGECITNKKWMSTHCKRTCKLCSDNSGDPDVSCKNKYSNESQCEKWAAEGECQINTRWMPENCRKSCHMCGKTEVITTTTTAKPDIDTGECLDIHNSVECKGWADSGECEYNPDWMIPNCRKSCGKCGGTDGGKQPCKNIWDDKNCEGWARDQECMKNSVWMKKNCHKACSRCQADGDTDVTTRQPPTEAPVTKGSATCTNIHPRDKECDDWAKGGHCAINEWMTKYCAKSCKACKEDKTTTKKPDTSGKDLCRDQREHCKAWADHGYCEDNPQMASEICKKSCRFCGDTAGCVDKNQFCEIWARPENDQCKKNGGYMLRNCRKSCKVC